MGEKADLFDRSLRLNTAAFWTDYRHYQTFDFNPDDCNHLAFGCIVNVVSATWSSSTAKAFSACRRRPSSSPPPVDRIRHEGLLREP